MREREEKRGPGGNSVTGSGAIRCVVVSFVVKKQHYSTLYSLVSTLYSVYPGDLNLLKTVFPYPITVVFC